VIVTTLWTNDTYETGGAFIPTLTAEARAGAPGAADFELAVGASISGPFTLDQTGQFTWENGVWYPFSFTHDPSIPRQTWTVDAVTTISTIVSSGSPNAVFLRTFANPVGGVVGFDTLRITSAGIGSAMVDIPMPDGGAGPASVMAFGPAARRSLHVSGAAFAAGFTITGRVILCWSCEMPLHSHLSGQILAGCWAGRRVSRPAGEDDRPRRRLPVRYPAVLLPALLAGADPDWATIMPKVMSSLWRD
jgi:hypothetical protein